jgi:hypothetical protein
MGANLKDCVYAHQLKSDVAGCATQAELYVSISSSALGQKEQRVSL